MARKLFDLDTDIQFTRGMAVEFMKLQREIAKEDFELSEMVGAVVDALNRLDKAVMRRIIPIRRDHQERAKKRAETARNKRLGIKKRE